MELQIWSIALSFVSAVLLLWVKNIHEEFKRLSLLLSKTREESAEKFVTKADVHAEFNRVLSYLDRLDTKLDSFMKEQRG